VASKIVQQMNVKLGMPIWSIPRPQQVSEKTMLIGIDIYHKLVSGNRSCMGLVASLDSEFTQYFSRIILMKKGQEMSTEIVGVVEQALKAYFENNDKQYLPDTIIIYRDGVGEGQVQRLIETELYEI
jgi:aubergine-like protein